MRAMLVRIVILAVSLAVSVLQAHFSVRVLWATVLFVASTEYLVMFWHRLSLSARLENKLLRNLTPIFPNPYLNFKQLVFKMLGDKSIAFLHIVLAILLSILWRFDLVNSTSVKWMCCYGLIMLIGWIIWWVWVDDWTERLKNYLA
ncbi:hypothetical protein A3H26_01395 [candidate division WWE3 bacterium RIFCSPLOWO2_12_FULL_36_10]|uniref:Uncharacterized protein n=1 Tax=candidate division WWE3 bacterium RIFCSPLOWO2_12_FULL_36_10 TaxID=1802630 RepID=A0A1F4VHZ6_UNCKA|nr:MAG: hypothetical protein A3H26_01395 [candidate division WWE3 bacterium RIFCSPLOWO2_12_FULL_36_10]